MAKVNWTFQALEDLDSITKRLTSYSRKYAARLVESIFERTDMLSQFPRMGRIVPEMNQESIRELIINKYRIIYSLPNVDTVDILAVHPSAIPLGSLE